MAQLKADQEDEPLDPAVEKVRRKLVRFVGINLGLLFLALMAVVGAIVYKSGRDTAKPEASVGLVPAPAEGGMLEGEIILPAGARIISQSLSGNRIALNIMLSDGQLAILVYDIAEKRIIGKFAVTAQ
ncbi:fimbrial protein [Mesorhizobium sp. NBSH29]|uniref:fimbrial protein n=1 Tax=Mesorhizobium sp. NBSH29 TaxID=2654249 RepID=UPI001896986A|nr:fimbrial protein [Mesorhizobium sp. NBSH29]QPC85750.1 fimbrial protein [Mesorhizobium sp. NBSH29]